MDTSDCETFTLSYVLSAEKEEGLCKTTSPCVQDRRWQCWNRIAIEIMLRHRRYSPSAYRIEWVLLVSH